MLANTARLIAREKQVNPQDSQRRGSMNRQDSQKEKEEWSSMLKLDDYNLGVALDFLPAAFFFVNAR